jgi:Methylamine utilisation protein MauE
VAVVGLIWILAVTMIVSGVMKIADPATVTGALAQLRLPSGRWTATALGVFEVGLGATAIAVGGRPAAASLGLWYLLLAGAAFALLRRGASSCGCFGDRSAPPSPLHVGLDLTAAAVAAVGAALGTPSVSEVWSELGAATVVLGAFVAIGCALLVAAFDLLPRALAEISRPVVADFEVRTR